MHRRRIGWLTILSFTMLLPLSRRAEADFQLNIDFDDREAAEPANTQSAFEQFLLGDPIDPENNDEVLTTTRSFGGVDVTVSSATNNTHDDRRRDDPVNDGLFTDEQLLRDFLFFRGGTSDDGVDLTISNLAPRTAYDIRIWSFDTASTGSRISDWFANGVLVQDDYTFDGNADPPIDNDVYAFDFTAASDLAGSILIEGRAVQFNPAVFINAISITEAFTLGDFDNDGDINYADFTRMVDNMYGHLDGVLGHQFGDFNLDNRIDLNDFYKFVEAFPAAAVAASSLPEPSSLLLVATMGLLGINRSRPW